MKLRNLKKYLLPFTLMAIIGFLIIAACGGAGGTTEVRLLNLSDKRGEFLRENLRATS